MRAIIKFHVVGLCSGDHGLVISRGAQIKDFVLSCALSSVSIWNPLFELTPENCVVLVLDVPAGTDNLLEIEFQGLSGSHTWIGTYAEIVARKSAELPGLHTKSVVISTRVTDPQPAVLAEDGGD